MKTVLEVSRISGISVRALHHYDAIGLLRPTAVSKAGYRLYGDEALERLQKILLLRELQFPLGEIIEILDRPGYDAQAALAEQIRLLEMQKDRLEKIIALARRMQEKGEAEMDLSVFSRKETDERRKEAREKWGRTQAWQEFEQKEKCGADTNAAGERLTALFAQIGSLRDGQPGSAQAQEAVRTLQAQITKDFYTCTKEILFGLGQMYAADERFRRSIDAAGGEGTAEFVRKAIVIYCQTAAGKPTAV